jgi:hypothetical protein
MKNISQRITLPLVFATIGLITIHINYGTLKRGEFEYIPREGPKQMFSAAQTPTVFWAFTIGMFVVGGLFVATAVYLFFRSRAARSVDTAVPSAASVSRRLKFLWLIVNVAAIPLGCWTGYAEMAPERLRGTNPDQYLCLAVIIGMPLFVVGMLWTARSRCSSFRRPSWYRNPFRWNDPLQALFITTLAMFGWAIGCQIRISGSGSIGFWTVMTYWCIFIGLVIGQVLGYLIFRKRIVPA